MRPANGSRLDRETVRGAGIQGGLGFAPSGTVVATFDIGAVINGMAIYLRIVEPLRRVLGDRDSPGCKRQPRYGRSKYAHRPLPRPLYTRCPPLICTSVPVM